MNASDYKKAAICLNIFVADCMVRRLDMIERKLIKEYDQLSIKAPLDYFHKCSRAKIEYSKLRHEITKTS